MCYKIISYVCVFFEIIGGVTFIVVIFQGCSKNNIPPQTPTAQVTVVAPATSVEKQTFLQPLTKGFLTDEELTSGKIKFYTDEGKISCQLGLQRKEILSQTEVKIEVIKDTRPGRDGLKCFFEDNQFLFFHANMKGDTFVLTPLYEHPDSVMLKATTDPSKKEIWLLTSGKGSRILFDATMQVDTIHGYNSSPVLSRGGVVLKKQ